MNGLGTCAAARQRRERSCRYGLFAFPLLVILVAFASANAEEGRPANSSSTSAEIVLTRSVKQWLSVEVAKARAAKQVTAKQVRDNAILANLNLSNSDIEKLVYFVLFQAWKETQEDLKTTSDAVKRENAIRYWLSAAQAHPSMMLSQPTFTLNDSDVSQVIQFVIREAWKELQEDTKRRADDIKRTNKRKKVTADKTFIQCPNKPCAPPSAVTSSAKAVPKIGDTRTRVKNNLDRHDLGPTFASPDATTLLPRATRRAGGAASGSTKTWAPSGAATSGGATTWAPAGAKQ